MRHLQFFLSIMLVAVPCTAEVIYVKDSSTGSGTNWSDAYGDLQDALDAAAGGDEIWVAQGTYYPTSDYGLDIGDRGRHFRMINGVTIYGGFPNTGDPDMADRDPNLYETILSGDLLGNDNPDTPAEDLIDDPCRTDNCYHVFYHPDGLALDPNAILDGFTVTVGNANGTYPNHNSHGGGMYNHSSSPIVTNCKFTGNSVNSEGGGMANFDASPTVANCTFSGNSTADLGGGMFNDHRSNPTVTNCIFSSNLANYGGGMYNYYNSRPIVNNCTFSGNRAQLNGGGMYNSGNLIMTNCTFSGNWANLKGGGMSNCWAYGRQPIMINCIFSGNSADNYGGGMYNISSNPIVTNCTVSGNTANGYGGGGMYNYYYSDPNVTNCIIWGNIAPVGQQIYNDANSWPPVTYSDVQGGYPGNGNIDANPCFINPGFWDPNNTPNDPNDDFWNAAGDYHLKSQAGRWDPISETWILDDITSPCIDAGNPGYPLGDEPTHPDNVRINMGAYGGTWQASKTPQGWGLLADLTNDRFVDYKDLLGYTQYWQQSADCQPADLDRDGTVDLPDITLLAYDWLFSTTSH